MGFKPPAGSAGSGAAALARTSVKTTAYTAVAGDLVPVDPTGAAVTITLPAAPADKAQVEVKIVTATAPNAVTVACGGSDVFNRTGGATSTTLQVPGHSNTFQYDAATGIWTITQSDTPLTQLDNRYASGTFNVLNYGAKCDAIIVDDGVVTANSKTITSASAPFTAAHVGQSIAIAGANFGKTLVATIQTFNSATSVVVSTTVSSPAATTGVRFIFSPVGTDDGPAIQAAINAAAASPFVKGTVVIPGRCVVRSETTLKSKVSVVGLGAGTSSVHMLMTGTASIAIFRGTGGSPTNQLLDVTIADMELDGTGYAPSAYNVAWKAVYANNMVRPIFRGLWVHDTPATGLGVDFLVDAKFINCTVERCGRLNNGTTDFGGAGIGIGTGTYDIEASTIIGCTLRGNKQYGVFFEKQATNDTGIYAKYMRVIGCHIEGNGNGVGDDGGRRMLIANNTITGNTKNGIYIGPGAIPADPGYAGLVIGNQIYDNALDGICYDATNTNAGRGRYTFQDNKIANNTGRGICIDIGTAALGQVPHMRILGNEVHENGSVGIWARQASGTKGLDFLRIQNNDVWSNGTTDTNHEGIRVDTVTNNDVSIDRNRVYDPQATKTQTTGILISSGVTITQGSILDNDDRGNATAGTTTTGATLTSVSQRVLP